MNHYLVNLNVTSDVYESTALHLIKAAHNDKAIQLAYLAQAHGELEYRSNSAFDTESNNTFSVHSSKLVNASDVSILKLYLEGI